jgi:hypothetical protein
MATAINPNNLTLKEDTKYLLSDGSIIEFWYDSTPESPREWDNSGKIITVKKNAGYFGLNKENDKDEVFNDFESLAEYLAEWFKTNPEGIALPLYIYEHSGVSISAGEPVKVDVYARGYILKDSKDEYVSEENAIKCLKSEIEIVGQYVNGYVWGFSVIDGNNVGGFYGNSLEDAVEQMEEHLPSGVTIVREAKISYS